VCDCDKLLIEINYYPVIEVEGASDALDHTG